jgi:MoaA/NifB/PqqE/SkfB family radical SAM enzyme
MPADLLRQTLHELKQIETIKTIGFSGGEPFLCLDLLNDGLKYAKELGFHTTVATNGFWGAWDEQKIVDTLTQLEPDHISFSSDGEHRVFIADEAFGRAVAAAKMLKIECDLCIGESRRGLSAGEYFKSMGDYKYLSRFSVYPVVPAGRAKKYAAESFYRYEPLADVRCDFRGEVSIRYDGRVFPCCSPNVFDTALSLGNINDTCVTDILANEENTRMFSYLNTKGFSQLVATASAQYGLTFNDPCTSGCEICAQLFDDPSRQEEFRTLLDQEYERLAVDQLLGRGDGHGN